MDAQCEYPWACWGMDLGNFAKHHDCLAQTLWRRPVCILAHRAHPNKCYPPLVCPSVGLPLHWFTQPLVYPPLAYPSIGLPLHWFTPPLVYPFIGLPLHWFTHPLFYQSTGLPLHWLTHSLIYHSSCCNNAGTACVSRV